MKNKVHIVLQFIHDHKLDNSQQIITKQSLHSSHLIKPTSPQNTLPPKISLSFIKERKTTYNAGARNLSKAQKTRAYIIIHIRTQALLYAR